MAIPADLERRRRRLARLRLAELLAVRAVDRRAARRDRPEAQEPRRTA